MSSKRLTKRANERSFPGSTERVKREPGSQARKDESKRRQQANKRRKAMDLRPVEKASRVANRGHR